MQAAIDGVTALFNALLGLIIGIIFPATPTALSLLAAFGIIIPLVFIALAFVKRVASGSGG